MSNDVDAMDAEAKKITGVVAIITALTRENFGIDNGNNVEIDLGLEEDSTTSCDSRLGG